LVCESAIFEDIVNKLFYGNIDINAIILSGDIGTGKTTLFSKIMQEMISKNKQGNSYYILPINIDFEKMISVEDRQAKNLGEYVDNLFVGLNRKIDNAMSHAKASKEAKNQMIMPIVFFDNLDLVYQKFCEDYFVTPNGVKFIDIFLNLIEKVLQSEKKYLLVCALRGESLNAIKNRELGNKEKLHAIVSLLLEVKNKTSLEIKSIIEKRLRLSAEGLRLIKSKSIELEILMQNIQKFENSKIDFEELDSISSEGLRNTVDLFFRVSPSIHTKNIFNRFFIDNYYIKKMHFMGDTNVYTQAGNGIFNIFLNNTDFRYMEDTYSYEDSYISNYSGKHVKKLAKISYIHTYWAKYFILVYLYQEKMKPNITPLNKKGFINFFSKQSTVERYEENLVRLILLGLSESRHGKIIDISLNNTDTISKFSLSYRGKYILENYIWSFDYLAVVVDDIWLEFPDFILEEFDFLQVTDQSYCHISNQTLFEQKRRENLSQKIKKVKLFLEVLKISYIYEKKKVNRILERLTEKQNPEDKFTLPDFSKIENTISKTVKEYASICNLELKNEFDPLEPILSKKQQQKLKKFFIEQYALGIAYGKHDLLNYHKKNIEEVSKVVVEHEELNDDSFDNNPNLFNFEKVE